MRPRHPGAASMRAASQLLQPRSMLLLVAVLLSAGAFGASAKKPTTTGKGTAAQAVPKAIKTAPRATPLPTVTRAALVWTGDQDGHLEPCGCAKPQLGGMLRRAGFLSRIQA